jgi:muramidase (phage lysozyme)
MKLSINRESFRKSLDLDDFVKESRLIIQDYKCPLCEGIYLNPVVDTCGHVFCRICILRHLENSKTCPITSNPLEESHLTVLVIVNNILEKQMVLCKNRDFHCEWIGKLMELEKHLTIDCKRQIVTCPNEGCNANVFREDLLGHQSICDYRIVSCEDCFIQISYINVRPHQDVCPKFKILCPQECGHLIERKDTDMHIVNNCQNTIIDCPYREYGCETRLAKKELNNYLNFNINRHNFLILHWLRDYQGMLNSKTQNIEGILFSFEEKLKKFEHQYSTVMAVASRCDKDKENSYRELKEVSQNSDQDMRKKIKKNYDASVNSNGNSSTSTASYQIGEKYLTKKRQRLDDDNPIILSKKDKIDVEILDEKEGTTILTESPLIPCTNTVTEILSSNKLESTFDSINISKGIQIQNSKVVCLNNTNKAEHKFVFSNFNLNRNAEWKVSINPVYNTSWLALGVCVKENVIANKYRFVFNSPTFNHSFFGISTNGYLWNSNNNTENNNYICNFPHIVKGEVIFFKFLLEEKELYYKFGDNKFTGKISEVYPTKNTTLCPCIIFLNSGDEVILEFL